MNSALQLAPILIPARLRPPGAPIPTDVAPPRIHRPEARAVLGNARLLTLYDQASWSEGPAWWPQEQTLVWSDIVGRRVLGWRVNGAVDVLLDATPFTNGNAILPDGALVHCEHGRRAISRSEGKGIATPIATSAEGSRLNAPNDLLVAADGTIWFSDPTFGLENPKQGIPGHSESGRTALCRIGVDGAVQRMADMMQPNGLAFSPDGRTLYASQTPEHGEGDVAIFTFDWDGATLSNKRRFATVPDGIPDGFTVDRRGWLWSSSSAGIEVFDDAANHLATVPTPSICSNCTFDGDQARLFITGGAHLWMLALT